MSLCREQTREQRTSIARAEDLLVMGGHPSVREPGDLFGEQLIFEGVEARLLPGCRPAWSVFRQFVWIPAAEDRVSRIRRRGRHYREIEVLLDLEVPLDRRPQHPPLIEAHAIHDDQHRRLAVSQHR